MTISAPEAHANGGDAPLYTSEASRAFNFARKESSFCNAIEGSISPLRPGRRSAWSAKPAMASRHVSNATRWDCCVEPTRGRSGVRGKDVAGSRCAADVSECRRAQMQMIYQDPAYASARNPRATLGNIVAEPLADRRHRARHRRKERAACAFAASASASRRSTWPGSRTSTVGGSASAIGDRPRARLECRNWWSATSRCPRWTSSVRAQIINLLMDLQDGSG